MLFFTHEVEEPGFWTSLIPIIGSGKESVYHFQHGHYVRGVLWGAMAVSDVFLVKAIVVSGVKLVGRAGLSLVVKKGESMAAERASGAVVHLTGEMGERGIT